MPERRQEGGLGGEIMAKMPKEVMDVFNDPKSTKVLATAGTILEINAVPKGSLRALDEELLISPK